LLNTTQPSELTMKKMDVVPVPSAKSEPATETEKIESEPKTETEKIESEPKTETEKIESEPKTETEKIESEPTTKNVDSDATTSDAETTHSSLKRSTSNSSNFFTNLERTPSFVKVSKLANTMKRKEGFLRKKSRFLRMQRVYWFELDSFNEYLIFYRRPPQGVFREKVMGLINLEGLTVEYGKDKLEILLKTSKGKRFTLRASTVQDHNEWENAIKSACEFASSSKEVVNQMKNEEGIKEFADAAISGQSTSNSEITYDEQDNEEESEEEEEVGEADDQVTDHNGEIEESMKPSSSALKEQFENFLSLVVENDDGKSVALRDMLDKVAPTVLVLLRHFGCMLCRQQAAHLFRRRMDFLTIGIPLISIGMGTPAMARSFAKEVNFPGKVLIDNTREVYKFLGCRHGIKYSLNAKTFSKVKQAHSEGFRQGPAAGDIYQLGGMFIISQINGFLFEHLEEFSGDHVDLDIIVSTCEQYLKQHPYEQWSSRPVVNEDWKEVVQLEKDPDLPPLIQCSDLSYNVELGRNHVVYATSKPMIIESDHDVPFYINNFADKEHSNYIITFPDDPSSSKAPPSGPFILTIEALRGNDTKGILRTPKRDIRFLLPAEKCSSEKNVFRCLQENFIQWEKAQFTKVKDHQIIADLEKFETDQIVTKYKFGILFAAENQTKESEMYANASGSRRFEEFLDFIGEKVPLCGWKKFKAGLDVSNGNLTGTHSIYTRFKNFEIMFHVSPYIPCDESDPQQIARKKHLGNDVVMIVFKEGNQPLDPCIFKSQFNHVFAVVQHLQQHNETAYRIAFASKPGVHPFGPFLPQPAIFRKCNAFRDFLLTKLINSERAAMHAPDFKGLIRTRREYLSYISEKFLS